MGIGRTIGRFVKSALQPAEHAASKKLSRTAKKALEAQERKAVGALRVRDAYADAAKAIEELSARATGPAGATARQAAALPSAGRAAPRSAPARFKAASKRTAVAKPTTAESSSAPIAGTRPRRSVPPPPSLAAASPSPRSRLANVAMKTTPGLAPPSRATATVTSRAPSKAKAMPSKKTWDSPGVLAGAQSLQAAIAAARAARTGAAGPAARGTEAALQKAVEVEFGKLPGLTTLNRAMTPGNMERLAKHNLGPLNLILPEAVASRPTEKQVASAAVHLTAQLVAARREIMEKTGATVEQAHEMALARAAAGINITHLGGYGPKTDTMPALFRAPITYGTAAPSDPKQAELLSMAVLQWSTNSAKYDFLRKRA